MKGKSEITYLILVVYFLTLSISSFSQNLNTNNIRFRLSAQQYIINYDLDGENNKQYNVELKVVTTDGTTIIPKSLSGDVGFNVEKGKDKEIVWTFRDEYEEIELLDVYVIATEDVEYTDAVKDEKKSKSKSRKRTAGRVLGGIANGTAVVIGGIFKGLWLGGKGVFGGIDMIGLKVEGGFGNNLNKYRQSGINRSVWTASAGLMARYEITSSIGFQWELLYTNRGHDIDSTFTIFNQGSSQYEVYQKKLNVRYVQLPLLFNFEAGRDFDISVGGYLGRAINGTYKVVNLQNEAEVLDIWLDNNFPEHNNIDNPIKKWDAGMLVGANFNKDYFDIGARFYRSLSNINNAQYWIPENPTSKGEITHWAFNLYATLRIPLKK